MQRVPSKSDILFCDSFRFRAIATEAVARLMYLGFQSPARDRGNGGNPAHLKQSIRVMEKNGLSFAGTRIRTWSG